MSKRPAESQGSRASSNRRITRGAILQCSSCSSPIDSEADHVELSPCCCVVCPECYISLQHSQRGTEELDCRCGVAVKAHQFVKARIPRPEIVTHQQQSKPDNWLARPITTLFSKFSHIIQAKDANPWELRLYYGLRMWKEEGLESRVQYDTIVTPVVVRGPGATIQSFCSAMQKFGAYLHQSVLEFSRTAYKDTKTQTPEQFVHHKVDSPTPLLSLLYGMATGEAKPYDGEKIKTPITGDPNQTRSEKSLANSYQSKFLATAAAHDILLRSKINKPCHLQLMLGQQLQMLSLPKRILSLLSIFRLSTCAGYNSAHLCRCVLEAAQKQIFLHPMGIQVILVDNIGHKDRPSASDDASKKTYRQSTKVINLFFTYEEAKELGLYNTNVLERISREQSVSWTELHEKKEEVAERLLKINDEDMAILTNCFAESAKIAIEDAQNKRFTTIGSVRIRSGRVWDQESRGRLLLRAPIENLTMDQIAELIDVEEIEVDPVTGKSIFSNKHIVVHIVKRDLSRKDTVKAILDYAHECRLLQLKAWEESEYNVEGAEPPLAESIGIFVLWDGQPAAQAAPILAADHHMLTPKYDGLVHSFFGPFHTLMKVQNSIGELHETIFDIVFGTYRGSAAKLKWTRNPGDNTQREAEDPEMCQGLYGTAAEFYFEHHGEWPSVKQLHHYMLERAKKYPVCQLLLVYSRFVEVCKVMKLSERAGKDVNVQMFRTALKFAVRLFTMTHKTDYVRLVCDFLVTWEMASPAMKVIYANKLFTIQDANGNNRFCDLFVEKAIQTTRKYTGKMVFRDLDLKLEHAVVTNTVIEEHNGDVVERLRSGNNATKTNRSQTHLIVRENSPITKLYTFFREGRFFHATEPPILGTNSDGSPIYAEEGSFDLPNGQTMVPSTLAATHAGEARANEYLLVNNLSEENKIDRSEADGVSLKSQLKTAADVLRELSKRVNQKTSLDYDALNDCLTVPQLVDEIEQTILTLNQDLELDPPVPDLKKTNMKKSDYIWKLIELRRKHFELDSEAKDSIAELTKQQFEEEQQPDLTAEDILNLEIFQLSNSALSCERYSTPHGP